MTEPPPWNDPIKPPNGNFSLEERKWREGITRAINILSEDTNIAKLNKANTFTEYNTFSNGLATSSINLNGSDLATSLSDLSSAISGKADSFTKGNIGGDSYISVSGGTNAVIGNGVSLSFNASNFAKLNASNQFSATNEFCNITTASDNIYSIGTHDNRFAYVFTRNLFLDVNNGIYADQNIGTFMFQWHSNSANANRTVFFSDDSFIPFTDNQIDLGTKTKGWKVSAFAEIYPNSAVGDLRLNSQNQYYNDGLKLWCETYTPRNWYVNPAVMPGGSPVFRPSLDNTISLGDPSHKWAALFAMNANVYSYIQLFESGSSSTTRAQIVSQSDGSFIIRKISHYGLYSGMNIINESGGVYLGIGSTAWVAGSDRRLKENIEDIKSALDDILKLRPIRYSLKEHKMSYPDRAGLIAQEVQPYIPEVVFGVETEDEYLGIAYAELIPFVVRAIQELSEKVKNLEERL